MLFRKLVTSVLVAVCIGATSLVNAQIVAMVDSGTNATVNVVFSFDFFANSPTGFDATIGQHGTTSSLIINQMAPGIGIGNYKVTDGAFNTTQSATDAAILSAAANPNVVTIALSQGSDGVSGAIDDASGAGKLIAIRSGNGADVNPNAMSVAAFNLPGVVIVGGTDAGGGLLPASNRAGVTAERYLATLGVTGFSPVQGTSFAAARLAAIAAEVHRQFPFLTGEQLAQVMFATALDFGAMGTDPEYGRGVVFDAAQVINSPAGPTSVASGDSSDSGGTSLALPALLVAAALGGALLYKPEEELKKTLILDSYGRPYVIDLTKMAMIDDHKPTVSELLAGIDERFNGHRFSLGNDMDLDVYYTTVDTMLFDAERHFALEQDSAFADQSLDWSLSVRGGGSEGFNYQIESNTDPDYNFGSVRSLQRQPDVSPVSFLSGQTFSTPYLGFSHRSDSVRLGIASGTGFNMHFGLVSTQEDSEYGEDSSAAVIEGLYKFDELGELNVQLGRMEESGSLFGGSSGGAFGVADSTTYSLNLTGALHVSEDVSLIGNYGLGYSRVDDARYSLLHNFSDIRTNWYGLGLVANNVLRERDQIGVAFSQPLRVSDGEVDIHIPYARDFDGNIYKHVDRIGLEPNGVERTVETYYRYRLTKNTLISAHLMVQDQPNHLKDANTEVTFLTTMKLRF
jgi:hypothetical protein